MKKIYLFSMMVLGFVATSVGQNNDEDCPEGMSVKIYDVPFHPVYYKMFIEGGPTPDVNDPNGTSDNLPIVYFFDDLGISIKDENGDPMTIRLNANGSATYQYSGDIFVSYIEIDYYVKVGDQFEVRTCTYTPAAGGSLPIKLTAFTGRLQNDNSVVLDWTSSMEWDSYKYEVERSTDGVHFTKVGELDAAGISTKAIKYTFNDDLPTAGAYFYRLKQIDFNGTFENSKIVYVNNKKGAGVVTKIFPNPTNSKFQLVGATSADLQPNNLSIFSITGLRIKYRVSGNEIYIDPSAPDGVYIVRLKTAVGLQQFKVIKNQAAQTY